MYVPVKGSSKAIAASRIAMDHARIEDEAHPGITLDQIIAQMGLALDRIMTEGGLYDRRLAALAFKQAQGDVGEAVFLLRAHRAQLPDFGAAAPVDLSRLRDRHISATHKELPGGQVLGATFDYTHRLLDFSLEGPRARPPYRRPHRCRRSMTRRSMTRRPMSRPASKNRWISPAYRRRPRPRPPNALRILPGGKRAI